MTAIPSPVPPVAVPDVDLPAFLLAGAARRGDRPAFVDGPTGRSLSYARLETLACRVAGGLAARGFRPGDVLAVLAPNLPEWPVVMLGAQLAGGAVTPINPLWTAEELAHQLRDSGARTLVTVGPFADKARAAGATDVLVIGEDSFASLIAAGEPCPDVRIDPARDVALLPYSSGTTGLPKGVRLTHRNVVADVCQSRAVIAMRDDDVMIGVLPFFHVAGFCASICLTLDAGATVVTLPRFDLEAALQLVERYRATLLPSAPPVVLALARSPVVDRYDLSSLDAVMCGSAPLSAELEQEAARRLGRPVLQVYGLTETSPILSICRRDGSGHTPGAVGTLVPGTEARLVDPATGADVPAGATGELWFRGPQVMAGYLGDPAATAAAIDDDGWFRSGDLGTVTADGEVFVVDRVKELIKVSGFQVAPAELEALLVTHPGVLDAAVIGRPDARTGERPVAFVVPRGTLDPAELVEWAAARTAHYKRLAGVEVVEAVPRSPAGKILRRALRDRSAVPA
ncbi:AMP-binding protein [Geodermatophilus sp. SYSU D00691]